MTITRNFQISFAYSFESKQLSVYLNKTKLAEVKLNLTRLNNICITLSGIRNLSSKSDDAQTVNKNACDDFNVDELVYLIADELSRQANGETNQKQLFLLKCYFQVDVEFKRKLGEFLLRCNDEYFRIKYERIRPNIDVNQLKEHWLRIIDQNCLAVNESSLTSLNTLGKMYHQLMHSNYMNLILRQEYLYAVEFNRKLNEFQLLGDHTDLVSSRIDSVKLKQQRLFSKLLFKMYDEFKARSTSVSKTAAAVPSDLRAYKAELELSEGDMEGGNDEFDDDLGRAMTMSRVSLLMGADDEEERMRRLMLSDPSFSRIEESYTIQLGAQLKTTHNLRLVRCDILDYCRDRFKLATRSTTTTTTTANNNGQKKQQQQQQQQQPQQKPVSSSADLLSFVELHTISTAMSLFSENKLCALVILVDACLDRTKYSLLSSPSGGGSGVDTSSQFYQICQRNGFDFQFPSIEAQIESAIACINAANGTFDLQRAKMNIGDFFVTKHSNLSQTHVVFHLAAFDSSTEEGASSLKKSDLSSRHPAILGLRNILKTCISHNIQTLTFPLLLAHSMTEEMTISWVMKRAELVLKCMKGFMIEFVQWGAQDSRILQFVVPQGLIDETFNSLSTLIKTIFRESRTYLLQ